ncbi:MAG: hypothetical protein GF388_06275, partial [Candidatus Aegiribacteria sp.]|nr:hypothetical protein [Candidatus Aegiribacteria sp.]MBD3294775.1 hypothetical protein [Candidatus Fermentibacteria bacterium]
MYSFKNDHIAFLLTILLVLILPSSSTAEWMEFGAGCKGDPALDIGDRVIYRDRCDLSVSPAEIRGVRYPTRSVNGGDDPSPVYVTVRNNGAVRSGSYTVTLEVTREEPPPQTYSISGCPPLPPYGEAEHRFDWIVPEHYPVPADVEFTASVSVSP